MNHLLRRLLPTLMAMALIPAHATIRVQDDKGNTVTLPRPAQRIVTLAPHVTEMVFAAGAGERIVGTVNFSDYPAAAKAIPRIGDNRQVDIERLVALKPDLIVVWRHNAADRQLDMLQKLGIPLFYSEPHEIDDIPKTLLRLGVLFGTEQHASQQAAKLRRQADVLAGQYRDRARVRVFYQVWDAPLYTLSGRHIVSAAIRLCGGENIFNGLSTTAPVVTVEAVLLEQPDAIVSGDQRTQSSSGLEHWKQYPGLNAVKRGNLFSIDGDLLNRPGPRLLDGATALCEQLDIARRRIGNQP